MATPLAIVLTAVEGFNTIFPEENVTIDVRAVNEPSWKQFAPSPQRSSGLSVLPHARSEARIVRAQSQLQDSKWSSTEFSQEHRVNGCVVVPAPALVAAIPSHDAAHRSRCEYVDPLQLCYEFRGLTAGKALDFRGFLNEKGGNCMPGEERPVPFG